MWKLPSTSPLCTAPLGQWFFGRETNQGTSHQCQSWKGQSLVSSKAILHKREVGGGSSHLGTSMGGIGLAVSQEREAVLFGPSFGGLGFLTAHSGKP